MRVNVVGAGLAGLSAALTLAKQNIGCSLISAQPSERAQSVLAEGGINAAMDLMGEDDSPAEHFADTMRGGVELQDPNAVRGMTEAAPGIVRELSRIGVPFQMEQGRMIQRSFGGQKKKRTAYVKSSTGKALMTAMIDAVRQYEAAGLVRRYPHHVFLELLRQGPEMVHEADETLPGEGAAGAFPGEHAVRGIRILDSFTSEQLFLPGPVILCFGGMNGLFPGMTTGTTLNTGDALAAVFSEGAALANPEFLQYHPTTIQIPGKRLLVSEAARGEGGRLFVERNGTPWYFMEEKYPELGNLMPRDVISREMTLAVLRADCGTQVYLDLRGLSREIWEKRLPDLRKELRYYLGIDPRKEPVPVSPGIHYFMGGLYVDEAHRTSLPGVYAAGECACQYHGANRLGGNSLLGALYGGRVAAESCMRDAAAAQAAEASMAYVGDDTDSAKASLTHTDDDIRASEASLTHTGDTAGMTAGADSEAPLSRKSATAPALQEYAVSDDFALQLSRCLLRGLGILREEASIRKAMEETELLRQQAATQAERRRAVLGLAILSAALARQESRGAHVRTDFPERDDAGFRKTTIVALRGGQPEVCFRALPPLREKPDDTAD